MQLGTFILCNKQDGILDEVFDEFFQEDPVSGEYCGFSSTGKGKVVGAGAMADLITEIPKKNIPNPRIIEPICFVELFFTKI